MWVCFHIKYQKIKKFKTRYQKKNLDLQTLRSNIFAKPCLPVHMWPRSNLLSQKNGQKFRDTVTLRKNFTLKER